MPRPFTYILAHIDVELRSVSFDPLTENTETRRLWKRQRQRRDGGLGPSQEPPSAVPSALGRRIQAPTCVDISRHMTCRRQAATPDMSTEHKPPFARLLASFQTFGLCAVRLMALNTRLHWTVVVHVCCGLLRETEQNSFTAFK